MKQILVLGGVSYNLMIDVDQFPQPRPQTVHTNDYHDAVGSTGAGKALALNKLGVNVKLQGIIGDDHYGKLIKERFRRADIPFYYDVDPAGTQRHVNLMNQEGERMSIFLHAPAPDINLGLDKIEALIKESDLVIPNIAPHCKRFIPLIKKYQIETWYDLHGYNGQDNYYNQFITQADVILFSSEENNNHRAIMEQFAAQGKRLVICTHGSDGATALSAQEGWVEVSAVDYQVVDTNGAGDNFFAGVLYGYLQDYDLKKSLQLGAVMGGLAVTSEELVAPQIDEEKLMTEYQTRWK